jgi:hypothetical protein
MRMGDLMQRWVDAMRAERFEEAWDLSHRSMLERSPSTRDDPSQPYHLRWVWDGRPFDERDVLVRCYHGLGDTLQFARFLPQLAARAASVTLEVQPRLIPLLRDLAGIDRMIPFDPARPAPPAECDLEVTELSFALRLPPSAGPPPYLRAAPAPLPQGTIGLCYSAGEWDPARSIPNELIRGIACAHPCLSLVAEPTVLPVLNPQGCPFDMAATASLVAGAELVITVDTMIAHLAGALNRPTWLLLKAEPDWRWARGKRSSPWYPSMRIFSQARPGDWPAVVREVDRQIERFRRVNNEGKAHVQPAAPARAGLLG